MSAFLAAAAVLALIAVLFVILPLLRARAPLAPAAVTATVAALVLIGASFVLYALLGNPAAIRMAARSAQGASGGIAQLARHVEHQPEDLAGWLQLAAAYGADGQYALELRSYQRADTLSAGGNATAQAGIGESLLMIQGGLQGASTAQAAGYFEHALALDPKSAKGLFYGALLAAQSGQLEVARARFSTMLSLSPAPPANVRAALAKEIANIDAQLHPPIDSATAIRLRVSLAPALAAQVPPNASLFVFVRADDGGAPLAVHRSAVTLPQDLVLSADDAMIAQRAVHPGQKVTVVARISASGNPLPQRGDLYGQIEYVAGKTGPRALEIDKLSP
jgi:cytochrome c-type biogenesis protein CcmH